MCLFLLHFLVRAGTRVEDNISPFHSQDTELRNEAFPGVPGLLFLQGPFSLSCLRALGREGLALLRTVWGSAHQLTSPGDVYLPGRLLPPQGSGAWSPTLFKLTAAATSLLSPGRVCSGPPDIAFPRGRCSSLDLFLCSLASNLRSF